VVNRQLGLTGRREVAKKAVVSWILMLLVTNILPLMVTPPYINDYETDADSQFTLDYHMTSAQEPTLWLTPTSVTCRKYGENFTIKMNAFDAFDVSGTKFEITYNTTLLDYVGIAWNAWGTGTVTVDEAAGNITGSTSGAPLTDDQSLITMDFKAAYYRIWRDLPGCINNQNGTIFIRWSSLSYLSGPDLLYERRDGGLKQINLGPDVVCTFAPVQGDLNNDGRVDMFDLCTLAVFYETVNPEYDLAGDEIIDVYDLVVVGSNYGFEYVSAPRTLAMVDSSLTSPSGTYRWMDVANQAYSNSYRNNYNYSQASVTVTYDEVGKTLAGMLIVRNLKPNFAYQLKLVGTPGTIDNERIGLAGRWWQETWSGSAWIAGTNLNDKGNGSSPNPNDATYYARRFVTDPSSPTGYHYRYTGYLVFDYFITDSNGDVSIEFKTGSCCHVLWKTSQRSRTVDDGPLKTVTFDPNPSQMAYDQDYPPSTVSMFGEWERLPMGGVNLMPGRYDCQILLTEESFHGTGPLEGNWAAAMTGEIIFTIV
jgi:hypothetical protein